MSTITITVKKEVPVTTLQLRAHVRYWCDATVNGVDGDDDNPEADMGIPFREGDSWCPAIDIATGTIQNWPKGTTANVHYKVCDRCSWTLHDADGRVVEEAENEYAPGTLCPNGEGYGDYIIMDINEDGVILGWNFDPTDFEKAED